MRQTLVGVFDRYAQAQHAAQQLRDSGFGDSVYVTDEPGAADAAVADRDTGVLARMRDFFSNLFGDDDREVGPYAEAVRRGGAVVKVEVDDDERIDTVREALEAAGAVDIDEKASEWRASGWDDGSSLRSGSVSGQDAGLSAAPVATEATAAAAEPRDTTLEMPMTGATTARAASALAAEGDVIPVVREELRVGKRTVGTGGVRVYARVVEEPVHESLELREEHAQVERRPVDRPASAADLEALGERTIEVRETAEQAVVAKEARVVEEVRVGKTVETRTERIDDSVRRTEVEVENLGAEGGFDTDRYRSHWQSNFAAEGDRWEDWEPAYRYGDTMRSDARWSGRPWDEAEPGLRSEWETRHPGSAWERFKAAIRHGWERMTD